MVVVEALNSRLGMVPRKSYETIRRDSEAARIRSEDMRPNRITKRQLFALSSAVAGLEFRLKVRQFMLDSGAVYL